ncbi:hypothetical protein HYALB_00013362 [Hymenoscyphus albidus]|uniref:Uncharacterized protein n=1 Tax=Hymenoscyphus albidus TaxID=595503 RepID=A0A9N9LRG0_9HELO|nr:hypothetical protein HYALB_00013362 [Hymenoscyphus albidus]
MQTAVCSLTDLLLSVFPASLFWSLSMPRKTKVSLSILMGLGIFIEGFVVLIGASIPTLRPLLNRNDHKRLSSGPGKFIVIPGAILKETVTEVTHEKGGIENAKNDCEN